MTDDLVKRLREFEMSDDLGDGDFSTCREAAERLEKLEKTLLEIANAVGDPSAYWIAHVALGGNK